MSKVSTRKALMVIPALVAFALMGSACGAPTAVTDYTGTAVVKEHHRSGKSCKATVELPDGQRAEVRVGHKRVCPNFKDNTTVRFEKGAYKG
jgi:hypothetical protein